MSRRRQAGGTRWGPGPNLLQQPRKRVLLLALTITTSMGTQPRTMEPWCRYQPLGQAPGQAIMLALIFFFVLGRLQSPVPDCS